MRKGTSKPLTRRQATELKSLASLPDSAIDTSDAPELRDWSGARRGLFYRPVKQQLTLRLDADVIAWFKSQRTSKEGYQTRINRALREYVRGQVKRSPLKSIAGLIGSVDGSPGDLSATKKRLKSTGYGRKRPR